MFSVLLMKWDDWNWGKEIINARFDENNDIDLQVEERGWRVNYNWFDEEEFLLVIKLN